MTRDEWWWEEERIWDGREENSLSQGFRGVDDRCSGLWWSTKCRGGWEVKEQAAIRQWRLLPRLVELIPILRSDVNPGFTHESNTSEINLDPGIDRRKVTRILAFCKVDARITHPAFTTRLFISHLVECRHCNMFLRSDPPRV